MGMSLPPSAYNQAAIAKGRPANAGGAAAGLDLALTQGIVTTCSPEDYQWEGKARLAPPLYPPTGSPRRDGRLIVLFGVYNRYIR